MRAKIHHIIDGYRYHVGNPSAWDAYSEEGSEMLRHILEELEYLAEKLEDSYLFIGDDGFEYTKEFRRDDEIGCREVFMVRPDGLYRLKKVTKEKYLVYSWEFLDPERRELPPKVPVKEGEIRATGEFDSAGFEARVGVTTGSVLKRIGWNEVAGVIKKLHGSYAERVEGLPKDVTYNGVHVYPDRVLSGGNDVALCFDVPVVAFDEDLFGYGSDGRSSWYSVSCEKAAVIFANTINTEVDL